MYPCRRSEHTMSLESAHEFFASSLERAEVLYAQVQNQMRCASAPHKLHFGLVDMCLRVNVMSMNATLLQMLSALREWLTAVHMLRPQPLMLQCRQSPRAQGRSLHDSAIWTADEVSNSWREQVAAQGLLGKESTLDALQVRQDPYNLCMYLASNE